MDLNKYTQKSQEAILSAQQIAQDYGHPAIEPAHLLYALLRQDEGIVPAIVTKVAGSVQGLRDMMAEICPLTSISRRMGSISMSPTAGMTALPAMRSARRVEC